MTRRRRDDEVLTDDTDEYEVWERKRDDPSTPAAAPDARPISESHTAPDDGNDEHDDTAWLAAPPAEEAPELRADPEPPNNFTGFAPAISDDDADPSPIVLDDLPDPPREPMRVQPPRETSSSFGRLVGASRTTAAAPPAPTTTSDPPSRSTRSSSESAPRGQSMRIAIVATEFNYDITSMMLERARAHADFLGATVSHVVRVPGVYDMPLAVKRLTRRDDVDGVVTLGCVIEGETDHDDLVIQHAARKIIDLSLESDKPIGLGITGPGMSRMQAMARIDRAKEAVEAVVRLHHDLAQI